MEGTPDMVLEILSDTSEQKDLVDLPANYQTAGIPEFWRIDARGWLGVGALSVGLAAGSKLLGWPYLILFVASTVVVLWRRPQPGRMRTMALGLLVAAVPSVPWLARAWLLAGDPLFPFAYRWFQEAGWNACTAALHAAHARLP